MDFMNITKDNYGEFIEYLRDLSDEKYRQFHSGLVKDSRLVILGVRMPVMRDIAKKLLKGDFEGYMQNSGKEYYEEVMVRGIITASLKCGSFEEYRDRVAQFLPYIDNWGVCDCFCSSFKSIRKYMPEFFLYIHECLQSGEKWTQRVGLVLMLDYYLCDEYIDNVLVYCTEITSEDYYVQMAQAWLLATAYAKYPDKTKETISSGVLSGTVLRMTVQKCVDSYRVSEEDKEQLKAMRKNCKL